LQELNITEVQSHSFVDFSTDAPEHMTKAFAELGLNWVANLHDYKVICPRINLADENGLYCGEPDSDGCNLCLKERKTIFETTTIQAWRETHERLLLTANKVTVPSTDVAKRIKRHFPKLAIEIVPHEQLAVAKDGWQKPILTASDKLRVVVVGAIGKLKGHDVLLACAKHARLQALPLEFILMGYSMDDPALEKEGVEITGQYQDLDALATLKGLNPHAVWLPSLWPETYSYTLSIALEANLPVFAFALGAITERLKQHNRDALLMDLALHSEPEKINQLFAKFRLENISS
jgi:O-antigen biosynthesis protein